jgi:hypothetical protein
MGLSMKRHSEPFSAFLARTQAAKEMAAIWRSLDKHEVLLAIEIASQLKRARRWRVTRKGRMPLMNLAHKNNVTNPPK